MKPTLLGLAAAFMALCASTEGRAEPSDNYIVEAPAVVRTDDMNAVNAAEPWTVKPESPRDWLTLRLQAELGRSHSGGPRLREISGEMMAGLTADKAYGVAAEVNYSPGEKETEFQVFGFGSRAVGPLSVEVELGLLRSAGDTGWAYTWRLHRTVGERWSAGLEGEGQGPLGHGLEREHRGGPSVAFEMPSSPIEFRLGYLFGLNGVSDLAMLGLELDL